MPVNRILFLTTLNLASNPRLVKEIDLAVELGYQVQVVCFQFENWSATSHEAIKKKYNGVDFLEIPAGRKPLTSWIQSVVLERLARGLVYLGIKKSIILTTAISRRSVRLLQQMSMLKPADWVIGHNPGALYPAYVVGKRMKARIGFDVEDYHPGEGSSPLLKKATAELFKQIIGELDYISVASPLFIEPLQGLTNQPLPESIVVLNTFPSEEFNEIGTNDDAKLELVWYSQHITFGRGLEHLLPELEKHADLLNLHLIGQPDSMFNQMYLDGKSWIQLHGTMPQADLHQFLATMDVGISSDQPVDQNREIAISNKVIAYLQAGLFVLASNTQGHIRILQEQQHRSITYRNTIEEIQRMIQQLITLKQKIKQRNQTMRPPYFESWEQSRLELQIQWQSERA
jgi:hypothetical protein